VQGIPLGATCERLEVFDRKKVAYSFQRRAVSADLGDESILIRVVIERPFGLSPHRHRLDAAVHLAAVTPQFLV
jgi:hypothetical protein